MHSKKRCVRFLDVWCQCGSATRITVELKVGIKVSKKSCIKSVTTHITLQMVKKGDGSPLNELQLQRQPAEKCGAVSAEKETGCFLVSSSPFILLLHLCAHLTMFRYPEERSEDGIDGFLGPVISEGLKDTSKPIVSSTRVLGRRKPSIPSSDGKCAHLELVSCGWEGTQLV